jgi:peptidoglycan/LPS O-acetylase OafA/YrhL
MHQPDFRINNFDLLRIFAATQVMVMHSLSHLKIPIPSWLMVLDHFPGVPIFFVISGFLISASYERNSNLKIYFTNRFLRIYPGLWSCIILTVITVSIFGHVNFVSFEALKWFLFQLIGVIYTPGFLSDYGFGSYNGSLWTIPIELQFYVILPVLYKFVSAKNKMGDLFLYILAGLFFLVTLGLFHYFPGIWRSENVTKWEKMLRYSFIPHYYLFLAGVIFQRLKIYASTLIYNKGLLWLAAYLLFSYLVPEFPGKYFVGGLLLGILTISMAYSVPKLSHKLLHGNDISYGVYIYHGMIVNIIVELNHFNEPKYFYLLFVLSYLLAFLSWKFIEKPSLRRKKSTIHSTK